MAHYNQFLEEISMSQSPDIVISHTLDRGMFDFSRLHTGKIIVQLIIFSLVFFGLSYDPPQVKPLKIASLYFHEIGHAVSAWATLGKVHKVEIDYETEGGMTRSEGGMGVVIFTAGYLFQGILGALALASSYRHRWGALFSVLLGFFTLGTSVAFLGDSPDRKMIQCALLIVIATLGTGFLCWTGFLWHFASLVLRVCGSFWCGYTLLDIFHDCITTHEGATSDAVALAQITGISAGIIGLVWLIFVGFLTLLAAYNSALPEPEPQPILQRANVAIRPRM